MESEWGSLIFSFETLKNQIVPFHVLHCYTCVFVMDVSTNIDSVTF